MQGDLSARSRLVNIAPHPSDGAVQLGQVVVDGGLHDGVVGVEVAMGEVVAHARDLAPRDRRIGCQQLGRQRFDGFADLEQADAYGVEYQPVCEGAAREVRPDCRNGGCDVVQSLFVR